MYKKVGRIIWRVAVAVLVWLMVASYLDSWPFDESESEIGWKTITHPQYGFSIEYPAKWSAKIYDEHGFKGEDEIKLRVDDGYAFDIFEIGVRYQESTTPNLTDVVAWGDARIAVASRSLVRRSEAPYEEIDLWEDVVAGHPVIKRTYTNGDVMNQDVYIARAHDMIIIRLQDEVDDFDSNLDDFELIVASFRPLK